MSDTPRIDELIEAHRLGGGTSDMRVVAGHYNELLGWSRQLERELRNYKRLEAILREREDVKDGPEGRQVPNEAMSVLMEWEGPS